MSPPPSHLSLSILMSKQQQLLSACGYGGSYDDAKRLIESGVDVECRDEYEWTPLMMAASKDDIEMIELLLDKGANIDHKANVDGWTALHQAANYLKNRAVKLLIKRGADTHIKNNDGKTALDVAKQFSDYDSDPTSTAVIMEAEIREGKNIKNGNE